MRCGEHDTDDMHTAAGTVSENKPWANYLSITQLFMCDLHGGIKSEASACIHHPHSGYSRWDWTGEESRDNRQHRQPETGALGS